jgi:hypothetical protein
LVLADEVTKIPKYYVICLFTFLKSLACLALQTETILKKIMQPKLPKTKNELTKICNELGIRLRDFFTMVSLCKARLLKSVKKTFS